MPGPRAVLAVALVGALSMLAGRAAAESKLLEKRELIYNNIFVFGDNDTVTMTFGHNKRYYTESSMQLSNSRRAVGLLHAADDRQRGLRAQARPYSRNRLGGGRTVSYLKASLPDTAILTVEIDKDVVDLAKKYFQFKETATVRAVVADGRSYLLRDNDRWDIVLIDAYRGPFVPFHLLTREFYALVKSRLAPGGVVVQNIEPSTMLFDLATATLNNLFPSVDLYDGGGNVVAVAYDGPPLRQDELEARAAVLQARHNLRYDLRPMVQGRRVLSRPTGKILTDDFAPVETMRAIEQNNEKWKEQTEAPR